MTRKMDWKVSGYRVYTAFRWKLLQVLPRNFQYSTWSCRQVKHDSSPWRLSIDFYFYEIVLSYSALLPLIQANLRKCNMGLYTLLCHFSYVSIYSTKVRTRTRTFFRTRTHGFLLILREFENEVLGVLYSWVQTPQIRMLIFVIFNRAYKNLILLNVPVNSNPQHVK